MAGMSAEPPDSDERSVGESLVDSGQQAGTRESEGERGRRGEHAGPLAIARHVKDDGRALILYTDQRDPA
jgi:hypothetical protein